MRKAIVGFAVFILVMFLGVTLAQAGSVPSDATDGQRVVATAFTLAVSVLFLIVCILLAMRERSRLLCAGGRTWPVFMLAAVVAVAIRVIVSLIFPGYASDMGCFRSWAMTVYEVGPAGFYTIPEYFADYPPGYMYILYVVGWLRDVFALDYGSSLYMLLIKLPSIIAEVVTAVIIYRIGKRQIDKPFGLLASGLILFNPAMLFNSSAWGQIDAVFILFIVLTLLYLIKENYLMGALFFAIALLIKPQAIMFLPVIGLAYFYALFKKGGIKKALIGIFGGAAVFIAVMALAIWPFTGSQEPLWIIGKYTSTMNSYPYTSLNAFNLFALMGGNFKEIEPFKLLSIGTGSGAFIVTWGHVFILLVCIEVIVLQWRSRERRPLYDLGAFLIISVFMLAHMMHERYILPAGVLLIFAYVFTRDVATLWFAAAYTVFGLVSQMVTLYAPSTAVDETTTLMLSAAGMVLYAVYAFVNVCKLASGKVLIKSPAVHH